MSDDVVAELEAHIHDASNSVDWVIEWRRTLLIGLLQRARDEIVALRAFKARVFADVRDEALEEAEIACLTEARDYVISLGQDNYRDGCRNCAAAIRALKDKPWGSMKLTGSFC